MCNIIEKKGIKIQEILIFKNRRATMITEKPKIIKIMQINVFLYLILEPCNNKNP